MFSANRFSWLSFDVSSIMPVGWREEIEKVARDDRIIKRLVPPHSTSREGSEVKSLHIMTVRGPIMWDRLPWLIDLYRGRFRELYEEATGQRIHPTEDRRYAVVMNVQEGTDRYECHVDTNPVEALLYVTDHPRGTGGELVVANDERAQSVEEVDEDCSTLYPMAGHLVFFDARRFPHYVRRLREPGLRMAIGMNYYTDDCPEETRPQDLNEYLYGRP
ncbi:2OG-Fe(II) oxygenase [Streptosporangium longisporum]|uniref:Prolyl 4-hydroxylase alpha subunit Fe(2+) 2OG dioxygenase domain-containing protein n=1 Tax=Streptosporangium longisporum TaxID=46187 RepID=A0ABN3XQR7_9ACTN